MFLVRNMRHIPKIVVFSVCTDIMIDSFNLSECALNFVHFAKCRFPESIAVVNSIQIKRDQSKTDSMFITERASEIKNEEG